VPDHAHWLEFGGGGCSDTGSETARTNCETGLIADDYETKRTNERNRSAGAVAMLAGAGIAVTGGAIILVSTLLRRTAENAPKPPRKDVSVRVLPVETPVRWVPPPAHGGVTVVVPALGGTW
jgi:hypothetical protein